MALAPPRISLSGPARDPKPVWVALKYLCFGSIAANAIVISADLLELFWPSVFEMQGSTSAILSNLYFYLQYLGWIAVFACVALLWLTYRLARNLHALTAGTFTMSPTYAIAMYIVPFANVFMPVTVVGAIRDATFGASPAARQPRSMVGWWWAATIASAIVGGVATSLMANAGAFDSAVLFDGDAYETALLLDASAGALGIVAWSLTVRVFGPIARLQSELVAARGR